MQILVSFFTTLIFIFLASASIAQNNPASSAVPPAIQSTDPSDISARLESIDDKLDSFNTDSSWWQDIRAFTTLLVGILGFLGGLIIAVYTQRRQRDAAKEERLEQRDAAKEARLETHLFDSLKWFGGGTQNRSIGLSVIEGNWGNVRNLHETWIAVLISQAIYVVAVKPNEKMSAHELENRRRICSLLRNAEFTKEQHEVLSEAIKKGKEGGKLNEIELEQWDSLLSGDAS